MDKAERTRQWVDSSERRVAGSSDALDAGAFVSAAERTAMVASFRQCMRKYRAEKVTDCDALSARLLANHPEARGNVLAARIFASFSARGDGALDVTDWTNACAVLAPSGSYVDKARAGFRAYDVDGDGVVDDSDLRTTLRAVLARARPTRRWTASWTSSRPDSTSTATASWRNASSRNSSPRTTSRRDSPCVYTDERTMRVTVVRVFSARVGTRSYGAA